MEKTIDNTFENGVHQDNELVVQPKGTYRRSVNGRITSRNDGSYAWESIKGNVLEFEVKTYEYQWYQNYWSILHTYTDFVACGEVDGKDKVFLFFVKSDGSLLIGYVAKEIADGFTVIYYLRNTEINNKIFGREIFTFSQEKPISGYSIYENAEIERIYFNNTEIAPLTLNIAPLLVNKINTYQDEVNSLETTEYPWITSTKLAKYYLVLGGAIQDGDTVLNPGDILTVSSQNVNTLQHSSNGNNYPVIVDFYPIQNAEFDPLLKFPEIGIEETITGALPCGNYVFAVSYYTKCHHYTNWSPLSRSVGVGKYFISPEPALKYKSVLDWQKYRGGEHGSISETGLKIVLKNTETIFDKIRIAAFLVDPLNNLGPGKIIAEKSIGNLLYEGILTDPVPTAQVDLTFEFTQYAGIDITVSEVLVSTARVERAEEINSMLNYGVLAGIQEESELSIGSKISGSVTGLIQEIPGDVVDRLTADTLMETGGKALPNYPLSGLYALDENGYVKKPSAISDNSVGHLLPGQYYQVFESTVVYPKGSGTQYAVGQRFRCKASVVPSANDYNYTGGYVKPVFPVSKYMKNDGTRVYDWIILDDQTGLKMSGNGLAGVWGNETYRIGLLPISKSGRPMYVRWIADWNTPERSKEANGTAFEIDALLDTLTNTGKHLVNRKGITGQKAPCEVYTALRYLYPLVSVDLTDIIDDISGFCIVVAPRDKKILSEGIIEPTVKQIFSNPDSEEETSTISLHVRPPGFNKGSGSSGGFDTEDRSVDFDNNVYLYTTPEHLFDPLFSYDLNSVLKPIRIFNRNTNWYLNARLEPPLDQYPSFLFDYEIFLRKFYEQQIVPTNFDSIATCIKASFVIEGEKDIELINPSNLTGTKSRKFWNIIAAFLSENNGYAGGTLGTVSLARGNKTILIELESSKNWSELPKVNESWENDRQLLIIQQQKNKTGIYTNTPESFASTKYLIVGHYQKVTEEFKNAIRNENNQYIVSDIQLTGLDCHVCLFDYTRSIVNGNTINYTTTVGGGGFYTTFMHQRGDTIIVPIQTSINIQSRNNRNSSFYKPSIAGNGICLRKFVGSAVDENTVTEPDNSFLEEFNYNWSFSNRLGQDIYPGLPINLSRLNSYEMRLRWGNKKIYGELDDAFRKYPVLQFMDVNGLFGKINNIRPNGQHLLYWQDHCVGYIPVQERVMESTVAGAYIQLGVGKAFEIYDELGKTYGNQDKLSLKEANEIFTWFDRTNRVIIMMDRSMKLGAKSKVAGLDFTLANMDLSVCANPFPGTIGTVYSYWDYFKKIIYMTFYLSGTRAPDPNNITFGLDLEKGVINGEFEYAPDLGYSVSKQLRTVIGNKIYVHDEESELLYGESFESFIEIVVTGGSEQFVKFVNMICSGNENFFTKIRYSANYQFDSGQYLNEVEEAVDAKHYRRFLDDMRFSIPQGSKGRMESKAMVVRFTNEDPSKIVKLLKTSTSIILIT